MLLNQTKYINFFDNSSLWAFILFFNAHFFYLAPIKIFIDNNLDIGFQIKIILISLFLLLALRNIFVLKKHPMIILLLSISLFYLVFNKENFINVAMPIFIGLAIFRVDIPRFLYKYFVITNIFWVLYLIVFVFFYELITSFDAYVVTRVNFAGDFGVLFHTRAAIGFTSPNNIGNLICVAAIAAILVNRRDIALLYLLFAFITFFYTASRSALLSSSLIFLFLSINYIWINTRRINFTIFYGIIFSLMLLALFTFFGLLDQFHFIDRLLSYRLHYMHLILVPSFFGTIGLHGLDTTLIDLLNKGGVFAFSVYVYVMNQVMRINQELSFLVIGFLVLGMAEHIINQYHFLAPLIFLFYFREKNKIFLYRENQ